MVDLRLLASSSHKTVAAAAVAAAAAAAVAEKGSWLEGSSAGPGRRNFFTHPMVSQCPHVHKQAKRVISRFAVLFNPDFIYLTSAHKLRALQSRPKAEGEHGRLLTAHTPMHSPFPILGPLQPVPSTHHEHGLLVDKGLLLCC